MSQRLQPFVPSRLDVAVRDLSDSVTPPFPPSRPPCLDQTTPRRATRTRLGLLDPAVACAFDHRNLLQCCPYTSRTFSSLLFNVVNMIYSSHPCPLSDCSFFALVTRPLLAPPPTFTFIGSTEDDPSSMLLLKDTCGHLWSRLSSHRPLPLQTLRVRFFNPSGSARGPSSGDAERLLSLFDPKESLLSS